jgi:hypothetical protein
LLSIALASETVAMGDLSGWPKQPNGMFNGPLRNRVGSYAGGKSGAKTTLNRVRCLTTTR